MTLEEALEYDEIPHHADRKVDTVRERMVVSIDLPENNVAGFLPREVVGLPLLERLGLWSNRISGSIPSEIGRLGGLRQLLLDNNELSGNIPTTLGQLAA